MFHLGLVQALPASIIAMQTIILSLMRFIEVAFLLGLAGSAIVVVISFVEDFGVLIHRDK
jgi:hypothetical protein